MRGCGSSGGGDGYIVEVGLFVCLLVNIGFWKELYNLGDVQVEGVDQQNVSYIDG